MNKKELSAIKKKSNEELQMYFHFKKRGFVKDNKKGKGSYNRRDFKNYRERIGD